MHARVKLANTFKVLRLSFYRQVSLSFILNTDNFFVPVHREQVSCLDNRVASFHFIFDLIKEVSLAFPGDVI